MVLEHDDALDLGIQRGALGLVVALVDVGLGLGGVDVGVLEDAGVEVAQKQALGGLLEVLLGLLLPQVGLHVLISRNEQGRVVAAAHLVDAHRDRLGRALGRRPVRAVLDAPAAVGLGAVGLDVVQDRPVGAGRAREAELVAEKLLDLVLGEARAHQLAVGHVLVVGDGVGGHDGAGASGLAVELEGAVDEGDHAGLEAVRGIDGVLAAVGVGLAAALARALSRPVLDHRDQRSVAPALVVAVGVDRGLQAVDERAAHVARQRRVLAEGAGEALPARVGCHVGLGTQERGDAHLAHLLGHAGTRLLCHGGVEGGGQRQVLRPVGRVLAVARVGREVHGDLVVGGLDVGLEVVCPGSLLVGGVAGSSIENGAHIAVQEGLLGIGDGEVVLKRVHVRGEAHEARDLLDREATGQVLRALLGRQAPVLVGDELARALEVLEGVAVNLDELEPRIRGIAQLLAVAVVNDHVAVAGVRLGVAGALGGLLLLGAVAARERQKACTHRSCRDKAPTGDVHALPSHDLPLSTWVLLDTMS